MMELIIIPQKNCERTIKQKVMIRVSQIKGKQLLHDCGKEIML
jgi:hypothetical protein